MLKRIVTLIRKDFSEFFLSKSWIIVLMMPLFIGFLYLVIYKQAETEKFTLAYTSNTNSVLLDIIKRSQINIKLFPNQTKAQSALAQGKVNGVILESGQATQLSLLIDKAQSQEGIFIVNTINLALINTYRKQEIPQINLKYTDDKLPIRWLSFPVWLLQIILTVGLLQAVAAIADEKEKQTFHSLLISPMSIWEYLFAKIIWYTTIGIGAIFLTIGLTKAPINPGYVLLFGIIGSLVFGALSLLIGLLAPTAMFARALATVAYLVGALPLMVRDLSFAWKESLYVFPSFIILKGFEEALNLTAGHSEVIIWIAVLLAQTIVMLFVTQFFLQNKADF